MPQRSPAKRRSRKSGRPLSGDQKRERVSFTLDPRQVDWLKQEALDRGVSRSQILDEVIAAYQVGRVQRLPIPLNKSALRSFCRRHHIQSLSVFGSILTDQFGPESDVDVLVVFQPGQKPSLFELIPMEDELSEILGGRSIDLKTAEELSPYFRDDVIASAEPVYVEG